VEPFHFITLWHFDVPVQQVWDQLNKPEEFPRWWPGFERAQVIRTTPEHIGSITEYRVRGDFSFVFDFQLEVIEYEEPERMKLRATGDFIGTGEWRLRPDGDGTAVTYLWNVAQRHRWIGWLSLLPGARTRIEQSHDRVMTEGGRNLAAILQGAAIPDLSG